MQWCSTWGFTLPPHDPVPLLSASSTGPHLSHPHSLTCVQPSAPCLIKGLSGAVGDAVPHRQLFQVSPFLLHFLLLTLVYTRCGPSVIAPSLLTLCCLAALDCVYSTAEQGREAERERKRKREDPGKGQCCLSVCRPHGRARKASWGPEPTPLSQTSQPPPPNLNISLTCSHRLQRTLVLSLISFVSHYPQSHS